MSIRKVKSEVNEPAEKYQQVVYHLNGITYVPHYRNMSVFVGPGYPRSTKKRFSGPELEIMGAKPEVAFLWSRSMHGEVSDRKP